MIGVLLTLVLFPIAGLALSRLVGPMQPYLAGAGIDPIPFFIQWESDSPHPSQDSPKGCELTAFGIEHPKPAAVNDVLGKLGIEAAVKAGERVALWATMRTAKGDVKLA